MTLVLTLVLGLLALASFPLVAAVKGATIGHEDERGFHADQE